MNPFVEIIRPANGLMAAIAVMIGFIVTTKSLAFTLPLVLAGVSAFLILSAGMVINDYYDYSIDKKAKPHRPLPAGRMLRRTARVYSAALFIIGVCAAALVNLETFAIALLASIMLFAYGLRLSKEPFTGNMIVAVNTSLTFVFGAAAAGRLFSVEIIAMAGMALFATLAREVYKSIQDMRDDAGVRQTLPMLIGTSKSALLAAFALATAITLSPLPFWAGAFGQTYFIPIVLVDLGFIYVIANSFNSRNFAVEAKYCKYLQFAALAAFLVGALVG